MGVKDAFWASLSGGQLQQDLCAEVAGLYCIQVQVEVCGSVVYGNNCVFKCVIFTSLLPLSIAGTVWTSRQLTVMRINVAAVPDAVTWFKYSSMVNPQRHGKVHGHSKPQRRGKV